MQDTDNVIVFVFNARCGFSCKKTFCDQAWTTLKGKV